jgi:Tol biopolymer transport system component
MVTFDPRSMHRPPLAIVASMVILAACGTISSSPGASESAGSGASTAPTSTPASSPAISPEGGTILFGRAVAGQDDSLVVMSPDGETELELDTPVVCTACAVGSPDGGIIAVPFETDAGVGTAVLDVTGENYRELPLPAGLNLAPRSWSPNGDRLAFDGWGTEDPSRIGVWASAADGSGLTQVVPSPDGREHIPMGYSPDGQLLLFHREGGTGFDMEHAGDLFVVDAAGGEPRQLNPAGTVVLGFDVVGFNPASWAPDSRSVAFGAFDIDATNGRSAVFVADVATLETEQVSAWTRWSPYARWSPTGEWIAFGDVKDGERSISIVKADGSDERALTTLDFSACCADWSPDGQFLVHQRGTTASADLWVMNLDGHAIQVTDRPAAYSGVWWLR